VLVATDVMGANRTQLTTTPASEGGPAMSPDGQWIVFHADREGNFEIHVMRAPAAGSRARSRATTKGSSTSTTSRPVT